MSSTIRKLVKPGDGFAQLSREHFAIFWRQSAGVRLLLFTLDNGLSFLQWTEWCPSKSAALEVAQRRLALV